MANKPKLIELTDLSSDPAAARYEKTATVQTYFAEQDGEMDTLEGRVPYLTGDAILTGVMGEKWPVKRRVFDALYEPATGKGSNIYRKKQGSSVYAKQMTEAFRVKIRDGKAALEGKPGDWLIQYTVGDAGVISNDIFCKSYRAIAF